MSVRAEEGVSFGIVPLTIGASLRRCNRRILVLHFLLCVGAWVL